MASIPRWVIRLRILHASRTSICWLDKERLLMPRPMIVLYRKTAFSTMARPL